jgi:hypothetical protein
MKQWTRTRRGDNYGHGVKEEWARAGSPDYRGLRAEAGSPRYGAPKLGRQVKVLGLTARPGQTKLNISLNNLRSHVKKRKPCKNFIKCEPLFSSLLLQYIVPYLIRNKKFVIICILFA